MGKENYSNYEGREVVFDNGAKKKMGIVTGCDEHIGVTIQCKDNMDNYLVCINGPMSPFKGAKEEYSMGGDDAMRQYEIAFAWIVESIKQGVVIAHRFPRECLGEKYSDVGAPSRESCPFSQ